MNINSWKSLEIDFQSDSVTVEMSFENSCSNCIYSINHRLLRHLGDLIILQSGTSSFNMECDAVLISGSCTVDESMLTGESVPISKTALFEDPNILFSIANNKRNTLFCGTQVLFVQPSDYAHVKAIVLRTGRASSHLLIVNQVIYRFFNC